MNGILFRTAAVMAAAVAFCEVASAQLVPQGDRFWMIVTDEASFYPITGGEFDATYDETNGGTLTLTGDGNGRIDPGAESDFFIAGGQQVRVDSFPVEVTPSLMADLKLVNSGGTNEAPVTDLHLDFFLYESGRYDPAVDVSDMSSLGPLVLSLSHDVTQTGNGFTVVDETVDGSPYVLTPHMDYSLFIQAAVRLDGTGLSTDPLEPDPQAGVTIEAGGLSGYDGLSVDLNARMVPEPASLGLLGLGGLLLVRRSR